MTTKRNIKDLLEKFVGNNITRDELDFLYHSVNHNLHSEEVKAWLYRKWDEAPEKTGKAVTERIFQTLAHTLKGGYSSDNLKSGHSNKTFLLNVLKYVAILVIGFSLAWSIRGFYQKKNHAKTMVFNEVYIPFGSKSKITLSDGTQVWLNSGSTLKYPAHFDEKTRNVYFEGEAFFNVSHDETRPFFVNTSEIQIKVLGTQFNVKSYPDENVVEATLVSGSIEIETRRKEQNQKNHLRLAPNQKATFLKAASELTLQDISRPDQFKPEPVKKIQVEDRINTEIITSWKDNKLVFSRERFSDIVPRLERWYNVQILLTDNIIKEYRYTGTFENETLEQALAALKIASDFEYTIDKSTVIIYTESNTLFDEKKTMNEIGHNNKP